jgi:putative transcriptional regulator
MPKKTDPNPRLEAELFQMAGSGLLPKETADKITMRILGKQMFPAATRTVLKPDEIRAMREEANMSQAVFAKILNVTTGYVSQLERGAKRPTGAALALLSVIKRKGIEAIL